jgi:hypothetical protein
MSGWFYLYLGLTVLLSVWLGFALLFPRRWDSLVDKEYEFWMRIGVMGDTAASRMKRFEKGPGLKMSIWAMLIFSIALTVFTARGE